MDGSLTRGVQLWLTVVFLVLQSATSLSDGCLDYRIKWVLNGNQAFFSCGLDGANHHWWKGNDACDPSGFVRQDLGTSGCTTESAGCALDYNLLNTGNSTFICCSPNGVANFADALETECRQIAICPHGAELSYPPVVEIGKTASVYMKVTTKPYPPPSLQLVRVKVSNRGGGESVNISNSFLFHPVKQTSLESIYVYEFQVPAELVESSESTMKFEPTFGGLPRDGTICPSVSTVHSVSNIPIRFNQEPTATTESPTQSTTATPLECISEPTSEANSGPVSEGLTSPDCIHLSITIGVTVGSAILCLIVGVLSGLACYWCVHRRRSGKDLSRPDTLPLRPHGTPNPIQNGYSLSSFSRPTPTDSSRLLTSLTPVSVVPHPLNHTLGQDPEPYATTQRMRTMSLEAKGHPLPPPTKSELPSIEFFHPQPVKNPPDGLYPTVPTENGGQTFSPDYISNVKHLPNDKESPSTEV